MPIKTNINTQWCRTIAAELHRLGVRDIVACPGARSAAMVSALREQGGFRMFVQTDERSAGFFALGLCRSTGRPAAVCVTSGSAVANLIPALAEAFALRVPLVVLSCDRPKALRDSGLPQSMNQVDICRPLAMSCLDLPDPAESNDALEEVARLVGSMSAHLQIGPRQGPVQINIPQVGRVTSVDGFHGWAAEVSAAGEEHAPLGSTQAGNDAGTSSAREVEAIVRELELRPGLKGLIVAGPDNDVLAPQLIRRLVEGTGFPLLADAPGSVRGLGIDGTVAEGDFLTAQLELSRARPDLVIRLGSAPVSSSVQQYLAAAECKVVRIDRRHIARDFLAPAFAQLVLPDDSAIERLTAALGPGDPEWRTLWLTAAENCRQQLEPVVDGLEWSEIQAVAEVMRYRHFSFTHIANSYALRLVNLLMPARGDGKPVYVNRGVSGIDGTFGTFLGELAGHGGSGLLVIGDLAAIHDIPAFEACLHADYHGVILILNNRGAALFDLLPTKSLPDFKRLIRNTVEFDFGSIAQAFGLPHVRCSDRASLQDALAQAATDRRLTVIEAMVPAGYAPTSLTQLLKGVTRKLRESQATAPA